MLIGTWKSIAELEENLTLEELELVVSSARKHDFKLMNFYAKFKGIDLEEDQDRQSQFDAVKRRAEARLAGKSEEEISKIGAGEDNSSYEDFGIEVEYM